MHKLAITNAFAVLKTLYILIPLSPHIETKQMTFKANHEKTDQHIEIPGQTIQAMIAAAFPGKELATYEIISGGCANLNIKISLVNELNHFILRVYLRDKTAAICEQKIAALIGQTVPIPKVYYVSDCDGYRFAITEYKSGITLRDLLLQNPEEIWKQVMFDAGKMLGEFHKYKFSTAGFFDINLSINPTPPDGQFLFTMDCLNNNKVIETLGEEMVTKIRLLFLTHKQLLLNDSSPTLVHADYGPENILVDKSDDGWKITAILDWEFAYSDSWLIDVSNMLRYAHKMPHAFEEAFLQGINNAGLVLPDHWRLAVDLFNLSSLLDLIARYSLNERPNMRQDISELIEHIMKS